MIPSGMTHSYLRLIAMLFNFFDNKVNMCAFVSVVNRTQCRFLGQQRVINLLKALHRNSGLIWEAFFTTVRLKRQHKKLNGNLTYFINNLVLFKLWRIISTSFITMPIRFFNILKIRAFFIVNPMNETQFTIGGPYFF